MRSWRMGLIIITLLTLPGLLPAAQIAFNYSTAPRTIRACTLGNANPYVLPVMARSALKPPGWSFVNPLAPTQVTQDMLTRWGAVPGGLSLGWPAVPPEWPQYWEVLLTDDSAEQLTQFDLIYVPNAADLNGADTAKVTGLRRAVENGAVLWVDNFGGTVNFPAVLASIAVAGHPLLSYPYRLSPTEIALLGTGVTGSGAARYGEGAVVATAGNVGASLAAWFVPPSGQADPTLQNLGQPNLELGYNIANYTHAPGMAGGGSSNRSLEFAPAHPPLDLHWQFPAPWDTSVSVGPIVGSPVVHGGNVYVLSTIGSAPGRTPALWCLAPGNYPNGYAEPALAPSQPSWYQPLPNGFTPRASSPTIAAVTFGGAQESVVLVSCVSPTGGAGDLSAYDAATGAHLWDFSVPTYNAGTGSVVDLASPVAYKNWIFLLATENDGGATYGRVWALQWTSTGPANQWVYPSSARSENEKLLPPSHLPSWVSAGAGRPEIPPEGDNRPAVVTSPRNPLALPVDAALVIAAPARQTPLPPTPYTGTITTVASPCEYCLVPTPTDGAGAPLLNSSYYLARLNNTGVANGGVTSALRNDGSTPATAPVPVNTNPYPDPAAVPQYAQFNNVGGALGVLQFLATPSAAPTLPGNYDNPLVLRSGCRVGINYTAGGNAYVETHFLPGPVLWENDTDATPTHTAEHSGQTLACGGAGVAVLNTENGKLTAYWSPLLDLPPGSALSGLSAPALEAETGWVASSATVGGTATTAVHGVRTQADLSVHLGLPPMLDTTTIAAGSNVTMTDLAGNALTVTDPVTGLSRPIAQGKDYEIDYVGRVVGFDPWVGPTVGGQALLFTWTDSNGTAHTNEFHVMPRLDRFEYIGGWIRLQHYPVKYDAATDITVTLADGSTVTGWTTEPTKKLTLPGLTNTNVLPNGWLNFTGVSSVIGKEVVISYTGWSEPDYVPAYVGTSPASAVARGILLPAERQQVPVGLGANPGGVAVAGQTAIVGSQGPAPTSLGAENQFQTLLSLFWDPVSHFVKGEAARPAYGFDTNGNPLVPSVLSAPATAGGQAYVGSEDAGTGQGWLGALGPRRTLICDGNRLVETTGADRTLVLTGSKAYIYGRSAPEPELTRPFSRPAKASALADGTFLVVDTGNNRVIAVDRTGQQTWPLDQDGNDYYSSPQRTESAVAVGNYNLKLSQPADAYQYTDANGLHTVIADTGHNRVVDVITTFLASGGQQHTVVDLTPAYVRPPWDPTHRYNLRYTRAQPIFDFNNGTVIGYLCAAANLDRVVVVEAGTKKVDPTGTPPGGSRPWSDWLPLYDAVNGPSFPNLRDVEYFRYGNRVYILVTAGGLDNTNVDGVWMWEIDTTTPGGGPVAGSGPHGSIWQYLATNYAAAVPFSQIATPSGTVYPKRFYPVCAKMLFPGLDFGGNVLITNYTGVTENLTRGNVGSYGSGLFGEVFEVYGFNGAHTLLPQRIIPDPYGTDWNDPLNQPAYAERY